MYEKFLEIRHLPIFPYPDEPDLAPAWAASPLGIRRLGRTAPIMTVGCTIARGQEVKREILYTAPKPGGFRS